MIDEKKIEEAAETQLAALGSYGLNEYEIGKIGSMVLYREEDVKESFKAGVRWFLDNIWHDASEEPELGKRVIVELKDKEGEERFYISDRDPNFIWKAEVKVCGFIRWFYVLDLLKGGK